MWLGWVVVCCLLVLLFSVWMVDCLPVMFVVAGLLVFVDFDC